MDATYTKAANAYLNNLKLNSGTSDEATGSGGTSGAPSFADTLGDALQGAINTEYKTEGLKVNSLSGSRVDLTDLVTAVSNAELTLNTVVAVRDRVISAYQDILRMPM